MLARFCYAEAMTFDKNSHFFGSSICHCFDAVGMGVWPVKQLLQQSIEVFPLRPGITRSNSGNLGQLKKGRMLVMVVVIVAEVWEGVVYFQHFKAIL